jgi:hypothetical protein
MTEILRRIEKSDLEMMEEMKYKTIIKTLPFLFLEMKKAANLVLQGLKDNEIKEKALYDNIFQVNTEARRKEITSMVLKRIKVLDEVLLHKLAHGDIETGKLIVLYTIMKTDRLFFEFMNEVFKEKLIVKDYVIEDKDFNIFFDRKREQSEKVAAWDDYTFYKLKQVFIRIFFEAGLINNKKDRKIIKPVLDRSIIEHLEDKGEKAILNIFLGIN